MYEIHWVRRSDAERRGEVRPGSASSPGHVMLVVCEMEPRDDREPNDLADLYGELRRLAAYLVRNEPPEQSLQATALVHDAWLRLAESDKAAWHDRRHLLNQAALMMRRRLIDRARRRRVLKKTGNDEVIESLGMTVSKDFTPTEFEALGAALDRLEAERPRAAEMIGLVYFAGMKISEVAEVLGISISTVKSDLRTARAWLRAELDA